jgi:hypothetical protein
VWLQRDACFGGPGKNEPHGPATLDRVRAEKTEGIGMMPSDERVNLQIEMRIARSD